MITYTYEHVKDTPLWRVYRNGHYRQEFTSLAAAKAWVEHMQGHEPPIDPTTGRPANFKRENGDWVTIAEGD